MEKHYIKPIVHWNKFETDKPEPDHDYLVCNSDGIIKVCYFDGYTWGYSHIIKEKIVLWSPLPTTTIY